uniref:Endoplasmic reticulum junction formation protein lunapark n=1 Tax=Gadus morhua TaxID=8049 RepID=A0A8C4ZLW1_GADMO
TCLVVYWLYLPEPWIQRIAMALPFFMVPVLVWFSRKLLVYLFSKRTERNSKHLSSPVSFIYLEEVMETETYKNAKLILERFDPEAKKKAELESTPVRLQMTPRPGQGRTVIHTVESVGRILEIGVSVTWSSPGMHPPGPPLARPVLPRERGTVDRVIEYLVGDGPQNRYALICQQCFSHNGMALKEEFEYIAFRCAYCYFMNPARKTRPQAPRLPEFSFERRLRAESPSPGPVPHSGSETEESATPSGGTDT